MAQKFFFYGKFQYETTGSKPAPYNTVCFLQILSIQMSLVIYNQHNVSDMVVFNDMCSPNLLLYFSVKFTKQREACVYR